MNSPAGPPSSFAETHQSRIRAALEELVERSPDEVENEHLEVKGWCKNPKEFFEKLSESCSCLANGDGGIVILGVSEEARSEARFSKCPYREINSELLTRKLSELTHPPVKCEAYDASDILHGLLDAPDSNVFALIVPKSSSVNGHMTTKGVSKIRIGKECKPNFTAEDDFTKKIIPGVSIDSLSRFSILWAISAHERTYKVSKNHWSSNIEFLLQAGLLVPYPDCDDDNPKYLVTLAAVLLFGNEETIAKHVGYCETVVKSPLGTITSRKNIVDSYRDLCETKNSLLPSLSPDVGLATLKELVINGSVHRCYRVASGVVITANADEFTIQSPGELAATLSPSSLIYCVPVYRNLLLAEGCRFIGLCDKVGQGIDMVYQAVLFEGFDFPHFESCGGSFSASIPLKGSEKFREFARKRSQALTSLDEMAVLRTLFAKEISSLSELASCMQRNHTSAKRVLDEMASKQMITCAEEGFYSLSVVVRSDIDQIFTSDQMSLGPNLFGDIEP